MFDKTRLLFAPEENIELIHTHQAHCCVSSSLIALVRRCSRQHHHLQHLGHW
jgi:hypothetical protein